MDQCLIRSSGQLKSLLWLGSLVPVQKLDDAVAVGEVMVKAGGCSVQHRLSPLSESHHCPPH